MGEIIKYLEEEFEKSRKNRVNELIDEDNKNFMCEDISKKVERHLRLVDLYLSKLEDYSYIDNFNGPFPFEDNCRVAAYAELFGKSTLLLAALTDDKTVSQYRAKVKELTKREKNLKSYWKEIVG